MHLEQLFLVHPLESSECRSTRTSIVVVNLYVNAKQMSSTVIQTASYIFFYLILPECTGIFFSWIIHINGPFTGLHICRYWAATTYWSLLMSLFTVSVISLDLLMCHCKLDSARFSPLQKVAFLEMLYHWQVVLNVSAIWTAIFGAESM